MNDSDSIIAELKRIRVCTPEEQQEFGRLGRLLLDGGVSEEALQTTLGYESVEAVRKALETGRITTTRLDRIREMAKERIPAALRAAAAAHHLNQAVPANGHETTAASAGPQVASSQPHAGGEHARAAAPSPDSRDGIKDYLSKAQHQRLRDDVERLWATDARFRNWTLLARAGGLSSGQAMKRAYEVGSSRATLAALETFSRLHAGFGSKATMALMEGVTIPDMRDHLRARAAESAVEHTSGGNGGNGANASLPAEPGLEASAMEASTEASGDASESAPAPTSARRARARGRKKQHLTSAQHQKLRKEVEALWEQDARLRNWSLLARAGGLRSGFAMKRAYDVNSSVTTARSLGRFSRLLSRFGRAAVDALHGGVPMESLEAHLTAAMPERALTGATQRAGSTAAEPDSRVQTNAPAAPHPVDFNSMLELGRAIDAEVVRLAQSADFFDEVANRSSLPRIVRRSAERARDRLRSAIGLFAGEGPASEAGASREV